MEITKIPYGTKNTEIENKTSKNNKNDEKITKNSDYENIKNKVMIFFSKIRYIDCRKYCKWHRRQTN